VVDLVINAASLDSFAKWLPKHAGLLRSMPIDSDFAGHAAHGSRSRKRMLKAQQMLLTALAADGTTTGLKKEEAHAGSRTAAATAASAAVKMLRKLLPCLAPQALHMQQEVAYYQQQGFRLGLRSSAATCPKPWTSWLCCSRTASWMSTLIWRMPSQTALQCLLHLGSSAA
jgi:hypothetical protein